VISFGSASKGDTGRARKVLDALIAMQPHRLHMLNRIEVDLLNLRVMLAEGSRDPAAALLSSLVLEVPVADFRASFQVEGPELLAGLRDLARHAGAAGLVAACLAAVDADPTAVVVAAQTRPAAALTGELTLREKGVLHLIAVGNTNKQVCQQLVLTENTVKFHMRNIFSKLGVNTRTGAISAARQLGVLT